MNTVSDRRPRAHSRTPLGAQVAGLVTGELDTRRTMQAWYGKRADELVDALCRVRWEDVAPESGPVTVHPQPQHDAQEACVRIVCALVLKVWERTGLKSRRACSSALFRGHTHRIDEDGQRVYVPSNPENRWAAGGLSAQLHRSPRTLDRYVAVLEALGVWDVWQPPAADVTKDMRGATYAYAIYSWRVEMPEAIARQLVAWWGSKAAKAAAQQRDAGAPAPGPARRTPGADATAQRLLERFRPPS